MLNRAVQVLVYDRMLVGNDTLGTDVRSPRLNQPYKLVPVQAVGLEPTVTWV